LNVYGSLATQGGFTFMPANVALEGTMFGFDHHLADHVASPVPPSLRVPLAGGFDAAWVRARIPCCFGVTPEPAGAEKALLYVGFAAVTADTAVCYPFVCTDYYGRSALMFSDAGPDPDVKRSIAEAFWGLLARDPDDLADFSTRVFHPGAGVWLDYGCDWGRVFLEESEE
jgi:hypothetical protein